MSAPGVRSRPSRAGPARVIFVVLLGFWVVSPFLLTGTTAQDGPAFLAAAHLVRDDPAAVYGTRYFDVTKATPEQRATFERWRTAYCTAEPTGSCDETGAGYLSPPSALLLYLPLTALPPAGAMLGARLVAAATLAAGMEVLWRLLRPGNDRQAQLVLVAAVAATPIVINIITLGQNTGILFLTACLGVTACTRDATRRTVVTGAGIALSILNKLVPAILLPLLVYQRRWRLLGAAVGWIVVLSLAMLAFPTSIWTDFLGSLGSYRENSVIFEFNRSFDASLHATVLPGFVGGGVIGLASLIVRFGALAAVWFVRVRRLDHDIQAAFLWLAFIVFNDFVWPHYFILLLPLAAFVARSRPASLWTLPAAAAATFALLVTWGNPGIGHALTLAALAGGLALPFLADPPPAAVGPTGSGRSHDPGTGTSSGDLATA